MLKSIILGALASLFVADAAASQSCTSYPTTLANGTTTDATQVMANFNCAALLGGASFTGRIVFQGLGGSWGSSGAVTIRDAPGDPQAGIIQFTNNALSRQLGFILGLTGSAGGIGFFGGPVGIGTPLPVSTLDVDGFVHISGVYPTPTFGAQGLYIDWNLLTGTTGETDFVNNQGGGPGGFAFWNTPTSGTPLTTLMFLNGAGNLGIGIIAPSVPLSLGTSVASIKLALYDAGSSDVFGIGALNNNLTFGAHIGVTGTAQMVLSGTGDVGIGTTTPTQPLVVNGNTDVMANGAYLTEISNASTTGTTANKLAKLTGVPSTAVLAATTDTDGIIGVVVGAAGTTGSAQIAISGQAACVFENATAAGDFVAIGSSTAGDCHDAGASRPSTGQTLGRVLATVTAGSSAEVLLYIR